MRILVLAAALLVLLVLCQVQVQAQTPAVPVPSAADMERRVDALLGQMTLEEKIDLLGGVDGFFIREIPPAIAVAGPKLRTPIGPSAILRRGQPSRGMSRMKNPSTPPRRSIFSSRVI